MPDIFGLTEITWHQAIGLLLLAKIFFGFGKGGYKKHWSQKAGATMKGKWKDKMRTHYEGLSDEE